MVELTLLVPCDQCKAARQALTALLRIVDEPDTDLREATLYSEHRGTAVEVDTSNLKIACKACDNTGMKMTLACREFVALICRKVSPAARREFELTLKAIGVVVADATDEAVPGGPIALARDACGGANRNGEEELNSRGSKKN